LTVLRILLVLPVGWLILQHRHTDALLLFFVAGISDLLDGFLARAFHWQSRLGGMLDPVADKSLMIVCYLTMATTGLLPWWLFYAVLLRDLIILGGALAFRLVTHHLEMAPTLTGKLNMGLQVLLVLAVLFHHGWSPLPVKLLEWLVYLMLISTVISGLVYVISWARKARVHLRHETH
jgi:cardiolipin synthase